MRNLFNAKSNRNTAMAVLAAAISLGGVASASADPGSRFDDHDRAYRPAIIETDHGWSARTPVFVGYEHRATPYVSLYTQALRAAPTVASRRVGRLEAGERFQALGRARHGEWILVGQRGVALGYVYADDVRPIFYRPMLPVEARYDYR